MNSSLQKKLVALSVMVLLVAFAAMFAIFGKGALSHWDSMAVLILIVMVLGTVFLFLSDRLVITPEKDYRKLVRENEELTRENHTLTRKARDAARVSTLTESISALLANMPAITFSKDVQTGRYLACNQLLAEFLGKDTPSQVVGLTDAELFGEETAALFASDDRMALSLDKPYIFHEQVPDSKGNIRFFQTTKFLFNDASGRSCLLGMSVDVSEMMMVKQESAQNYEAYEQARSESAQNLEAYEKAKSESDQNLEAYEKARSESITYSRLARALSSNYTFLYYVDLNRDDFVEYSTGGMTGDMQIVRKGKDFFNQSRKDARGLIHEEDRDIFCDAFNKENVLRHIDNDGAFTISYRLLIDGVPNYMSLKAVRMEEDDDRLIIGVSNIDARMKEEEIMHRMREEQITYSRIAALSGDFISIYMVNPITDQYTQFSASNELDVHFIPKEGEDFFKQCKEAGRAFIFADDLDYFLGNVTKEKIFNAIRESGVFDIDFRAVAGSEPRYVNLRAVQITEGESTQLIVGITDIDARIRHEQEHARSLQRWKAEGDRLLDMSERAMAANEAKTAFLSKMSHEIRTPINAVMGLNEMILRESRDEHILNYSESLQAAGNTLLSLVNDILDYSKIEAGKLEILPVDYDISSLLNDLVNLVQNKADEKGLEFVLEFDEKIPKLLKGDEIRIKQVVANMLTNAVKYTDSGRVVFSVAANRPDPARDEVILDVSVKDSGRGIKEEDMKKLFAGFERIEEDRNPGIEGTGLGMSISGKLLELMGSTLRVKSIYGMGSEFAFSLRQEVLDWEPLGSYAAVYKRNLKMREKYREAFRAPNAHVLAVDDNQMNLTVFKGLLKKTGVNIDTATSGDEGLALLKEKKYDIIFLDHMMPEKDGIETLHELRAMEDNPNLQTPVICLTANAVSGARQQYIEEGFDDYLTKPIYPVRLEEMIISYLPEEKLERISDTEDEPAEAEEIPEELSALKGQRMININAGIENSGGVAAYMPLLRLFYNSIDEEGEQLDRFLAQNDLKNYTIKVHALKSSAMLIGAGELGETALALETAGKDGDGHYIDAHHGEFMEGLSQMGKLLAGVFDRKENEEKMPVDDKLMDKAYKEIRDAVDDMDSSRLFKVFSAMEKYSIPEKEESLWKDLREALDRYDFEDMEALMNRR